jgi:hypothetical protein
MPTTKTTSGGRDNNFSKTYTDAADWNDSLCGVKHKVTLSQEGNKIRIKLDAWKDYPSSDILGNLRRGKWDKDNSAHVPHSLKLWIRDVNTGEYFVGNQLGEGVEVFAGDGNLYEWSAEYPATYEVKWMENSTSICRSLGYVDSKRYEVNNSEVEADNSNSNQEEIDRIGTVLVGIVGLTLVYSLYHFLK